ncbi:MAG: uracil-DNA glycosylase [Acidobacteria bacterium]|nr:MAG: uracil-DNA glycosylase [Acidobacteriota bacterium]
MTRDDVAAHLDYFGELGVTGVSKDSAWTSREARVSGSAGEMVSGLSGEPVPGMSGEQVGSLSEIRAEIGDCQRCKLCSTRTNIVFGVGNPNARLMFVGEAPGADEDEQGEPFVGRAGQLLTKIIEAMGFQRSEVFIANVLKCRPPNNRAPEPDEVATCEPFLFKQIDTIKPKVIVALGTHAAHALLKIDTPISKIRGQVLAFRGETKLVPTFHPAFLLRSPDRKRDVWEDMKKVRALLSDSE